MGGILQPELVAIRLALPTGLRGWTVGVLLRKLLGYRGLLRCTHRQQSVGKKTHDFIGWRGEEQRVQRRTGVIQFFFYFLRVRIEDSSYM